MVVTVANVIRCIAGIEPARGGEPILPKTSIGRPNSSGIGVQSSIYRAKSSGIAALRMTAAGFFEDVCIANSNVPWNSVGNEFSSIEFDAFGRSRHTCSAEAGPRSDMRGVRKSAALENYEDDVRWIDADGGRCLDGIASRCRHRDETLASAAEPWFDRGENQFAGCAISAVLHSGTMADAAWRAAIWILYVPNGPTPNMTYERALKDRLPQGFGLSLFPLS